MDLAGGQIVEGLCRRRGQAGYGPGLVQDGGGLKAQGQNRRLLLEDRHTVRQSCGPVLRCGAGGQELLRLGIRPAAVVQTAAGAHQGGKVPIRRQPHFAIVQVEVPGGQGADILTYIMCVEELSKVCGTTGVVVSAHTSLCVDPILTYGTEDQKQKFLPDLCSGKNLVLSVLLSRAQVQMLRVFRQRLFQE